MTTPPVFTDEAPLQGTGRRPDDGDGDNSVQVWALRILSALIIPALLGLFFFTFQFLKDPGTNKLLQIAVAVVVGVGGVWILYWAMDRLVNVMPLRVQAGVRPFAFAGPAMVLLGFFLVYPAVHTFILSFQDNRGEEFVGLANYQRAFTESTYLISLRNSILWAIVVPVLATVIGLVFATLVDRMPRRSESFAKSLIFLPMGVSFVAASVVWTFVYSYRAEGFGEQIGILNAIVVAFGNDPIFWLQQQPWNNLFLMVILVWTQTGFAMVILSSALKGVPEDLVEAGRIDGANEWQVFRRIVVPTIASTIVVVWTTVLITTWKVFDIVWVMTNGADGTSVVAERMMTEFFTNRNEGLGAALAVILLVVVTPILVINIKRFQQQEAIR